MIEQLFSLASAWRKRRLFERNLKRLNNPPHPVKLKTLLNRDVICIGPGKWVVKTNDGYHVGSTDTTAYYSSLNERQYTGKCCIANLSTINKHHGITAKSVEDALNEISGNSKSSE